MCKPTGFICSVLLVVCLCLAMTANGQKREPILYPDDPVDFKNQFIERTPPLVHVAKRPGHYTITDWDDVIDETWGDGLPKSTKLNIFDIYWNKIDQDFACLVNHPYYYMGWWDDLRSLYRAEIDFGDPTYGVSRGRFAGIMNAMSRMLRETHTASYDIDVTNTTLDPGVPLYFIGAWAIVDHFGAGLTPLPDNSLLVYKVAPDHPLGLVPGDIVLGYDGIPWADIYPELLAAELPVCGRWWMTCESAYIHSNLMSAGMNWHLFDTIDILKYDTGETINLSTDLMVGHDMELIVSEQMPIPGIPWPDVYAGERATFGIIDGTQIGYIYVLDWSEVAGQEFYEAVEALVNDYETTGLIIDSRLNYGGSIAISNPAMAILFNTNINHMDWAERCNVSDHLALCPVNNGGQYAIPGNPSSYYDKPIAMLVGPGSNSAGDQMPLRMRYHPMVRFFGKSTSTAFSIRSEFYSGHGQYYASYSPWNTYLVDDPGNYLTRVEIEVDEEVWLTPDDVAQGNDTVVDAAIEWINSLQNAQADVTSDLEEINIALEQGDIATSEMTIGNIGDKALFYSLTPETGSGLRIAPGKETVVYSLNQKAYASSQKTGQYLDPTYFDDYLPPDDPKSLTAEGGSDHSTGKKLHDNPIVLNHGGPDDYGYVWIDSDQPHGPSLEWIDISGIGNPITLGDDASAGPYEIGFDFPFYENYYSELYVCSNGYLTFGGAFVDYINDPIPTPNAPNNLVAIWWDDLNPTGREIYYYFDEVNERFIVSFINIPRYNYGGSLTFQAVLYRDGHIQLNYGTMAPGSGYSGGHMLGWGTVGVENIDGTVGLEVICDRAYMHSDLSIIINTDWLCVTPYSGTIAPGENEIATVTFSAKHLAPGSYTGNIYLGSNDPDEPLLMIPVSLEITGGCDYVIGDYNGSGAFNVADIVDGYSRLKTGLPEPAYECECPYGSGNEWPVAMDVNNSCAFNVADIVDGYSKLKTGSPELEPCEDCPPLGWGPGPDRDVQRNTAPILKSKKDSMFRD